MTLEGMLFRRPIAFFFGARIRVRMPEECRLFTAFVAASLLLHVSVEVEPAKNISALLLKALLPLLPLLQDLLSHDSKEVESLFN